MNKLTLLAIAVMLPVFCGCLQAQTWDETTNGGGDAGELPGTAQSVTGSGSLTNITGDNPANADRDAYLIHIDTPSSFSATTDTNPGTNTDTQLYLFDSAGNGIAFNDDYGSGYRSTLPSGNSLYNSLAAGDYIIVVAPWHNVATSTGGAIFPSAYGTIEGPTGAGGSSPLSTWSTSQTASGTYNITLTGCSFVTAASDDVGVSAITAPTTGVGLTATEAVTITLHNYGSSTQTSIPVSFSVNAGTPVSETYTGSLAGGATDTYTFTATADLSSAGTTYAISATTALSGDANSSNDSTSVNVTNIQPLSLPFTEDFSTATGTTPPSGWTNNTITGAAYDVWHFDNPGAQTLNAPITSPAAIFDSDDYSSGGGAEDVALESPLFDASSTSTVYLSFDQFFEDGASGAVFVEVYDGSTWNQVYTTTTITPDPDHQVIDISSDAAGVAGAQVRFRWTGNWSYWWIVDNVSVTDTVPQQNPVLSVQRDATSTPVAISDGSTVVVPLGDTLASLDLLFSLTDPNSGDSLSFSSTVTPSGNITNFTQTDWDAAASTTQPVEATPTTGTFTTGGPITVTISYTDGVISTPLTFNFTINVLSYVNTLPFLDDFEPATNITNRTTQDVGTFPSGTTTPPATATFTTAAQVQVGITTGTTTPIGTQQAMIDFPNGDACGAIDYYFDLSALNASTDAVALSFDYAENNDEPDDEDGVFLSLDGGANWVLNLNVLANATTQNVYATRIVDLSGALVAASLNYTSQVVIRFQGQDNSSNAGGDGHFFDNIRLYEAPDIDVQRPAGVANSLGSGTVTDSIGNVPLAGQTFVYTIANLASGDLDLTGTPIVDAPAGQQNNCSVSVNSTSTANPVTGGSNTTFSVTVTPSGTSAFTFDIVIASNDPDEGTYTITVDGTGVSNAPAVANPASGSNFSGGANGPLVYAVDPGTTLANGDIELSDAEGDTITVASITAPSTVPTGITAPTVPAAGQPITLSWSGTADASNPPGDYTWQVTFSDAVNGTSVVVDVTITINDLAPTSAILNASGGDGSGATPYTASFAVGDNGGNSVDLATVSDANTSQTVILNGTPGQTGGPSTGTGFQFSLAGGVLSVAPAGTLVAADAGTQTFDVTVTDGGANTAIVFAVSLDVASASGAITFTNSSPLPDAVVNTAYTVTLAATGGTGPYTYSLVNNSSLPAGLSLNGATGEISGTATVAASATFDVRAVDTTNDSATATFQLTVKTAGGSSSGGGSGGGGGGCVATGGVQYSWLILAGLLGLFVLVTRKRESEQ